MRATHAVKAFLRSKHTAESQRKQPVTRADRKHSFILVKPVINRNI